MDTIVLNGISILRGEIQAILTLMRANTRWSVPTKLMRTTSTSSVATVATEKVPSTIITGYHGGTDIDEFPLAQSFRILSEYLEGIYDLQDVDMDAYVSPFHDIVVSDQANGPLTCAALASLVKFASYGFFSSNFPRAKEGVALLADCIAHCIFEATDWESDELILMKLLELSTLTYKCDASRLLSVNAALDIYNTCISLQSHYQAKIMQFEAEVALRQLTAAAFSRAHFSNVKVSGDSDESIFNGTDSDDNSYMTLKELESVGHSYLVRDPDGIPLLLGKIMTILRDLIDLQYQSVSGVVFALTLVNIAIEAGGSAIGSIPILVDILRDDVCRHLFKACQTENIELFSLALRVAFNLFTSIKDHVKIQLEVFIAAVHLKIITTPQGSVTSEAREELALESLLEFCREPSFMQDLYTNYDCDIQSTNLFETIASTLAQRALPDGFKITKTLNSSLSESEALNFNSDADMNALVKNSSTSNILNRLSFQGIESILHSISLRCQQFGHELTIRSNDVPNVTGSENDLEDSFSEDKGPDADIFFLARTSTAEILRRRKVRKEHLRTAAEKFNKNSLKAEWVNFALDNGILVKEEKSPITLETYPSSKNSLLEMNLEAKSVAHFLRFTPGLSKQQIGIYIGKGPADMYPFHAAVLREYVETFQFEGKFCNFDSALRLFLGQFLLPGEAQCIDRIMEAFAGKLFRALGPDKPFATCDCAFILAFSTIMLNTDLHNAQIPVNKKMTKEQFVRNNRGINDQKDLPREYLENLYDEIKANQIRIDEVDQEAGCFTLNDVDYSDATEWGKYLQSRIGVNNTAAFTPSVTAREEAKFAYGSKNIEISKRSRLLILPIMHEKDMFLTMGNQAFDMLLNMWTFVVDDNIMSKLVTATCDFIEICGNLKLSGMLGRVITALTKRGSLLMEYERRVNRDIADSDSASNQTMFTPSDTEILKRNLEVCLKADWDSFHSPKSKNVVRRYIIHDSSAFETSSQYSVLSWVGSSKIRGEILIKIVLHFLKTCRRVIPHESWSCLVDILRFSRLQGALPPSLVSIRTQYDSLTKTNKSISLPLSIFGVQCMESFRPKSKLIQNSSTKTNEVKKSTSLWNLLWSDDQEESSVNESQRNARTTPTIVNRDYDIDDKKYRIGNIYDLILHLSAANDSSGKGRAIDVFNGNIVDALRGGNDTIFDSNYDLLRALLATNKIEEIIFQFDPIDEGIAVISLFDALMQALTDIINMILSLQNPTTVQRLQVDAILMLEWMATIVLANPFLVDCLWNKLHRSVFTMVFDVELAKLSARAPYFLEYAVVIVLHLSGRILGIDHGIISANAADKIDKNGTHVETMWSTLQLLKSLPMDLIPKMGNRLAIGLLSFIRVTPTIAAIDTSQRWKTITDLLSMSTNNTMGRVFVWEAINDIIDNNYISSANFDYMRSLVCQYLFGDFHPLEQAADGSYVDYYSIFRDDLVIDRTLPWLPYVMMHMLKLTLMIVLGTTTSTESVLRIPLPTWPGMNEPESDRIRVVYDVISEEIFDSKIHEQKMNSNSIPATPTSAAGKVDYQRSAPSYYATHIALRPLLYPVEEVELMWLKSCYVMSDLIDIHGSSKVSLRAMLCLQALIEAGNDSAMPSKVWSTLLLQLFDNLPLLLQLPSSNQATSSDSAGSNHSVAMDASSHGISSEKDVEIMIDINQKCCDIIFHLIIHHVRELQTNTDFPTIWLQFLEILTKNLGFVREYSHMIHQAIQDRIMDMIMTSLHLLVSAITVRQSKHQGSQGSQGSTILASESFDSHDDLNSKSDEERVAMNVPAPEGLFQFVTELLGFTGSPAPVSSESIKSSKSETISQSCEATPMKSNSAASQAGDIPQLTAKAMDLSSSSKFSTPVKVTAHSHRSTQSEGIKADATPSSTTNPIPMKSTYTTPIPLSNPLLQESPLPLSKGGDEENIEGYEKLLTMSWTRIISTYQTFPDIIKESNPQLLAEISKHISSKEESDGVMVQSADET